MSPQDVVNSINDAYASRVLLTGNVYNGVTSNGLKIRMYLNSANKIISSFPIY